MSVTRNIKCPKCGLFNTDKEYCENCNTLISDKKKRALKKEALKKIQVAEAKQKIANPNLAERLKKHPFFLYKILGWVLYSAFLLVSIIGAGLAWFIAMLAAG
ncbi:hypothetical protein J2Q11_08385 [Tenacibaculum finnmarkense genomovar finnmarkense]|uniref:Uncharacterized protein n=2 Tax=Tenacibaculum finnmarkense TaxID=2781243 RepID=A0A2I2M8V6_9FLAO|nr:hypothetical protein [Tenacibaculum finnmarkense]ALU75376.1 hypothetical protein AUW17_08900 [Tenacibaculum dicentrarchi]MBE7632778.1 hypothetical protein [Tenacibaculum finnmarkense genomovar ulcerans]MBE7644428.1 hypothetical protein [Tenacibaculum finnmarkense genomovar ulcerans]MBE7648020.1 hypothetical protein [Tenacibaculum finnmarkense genomovar ulcerans]MBE7652355.1 hypothetical protein [Tenacibaculum finnmarkense genomovar finnmarkense]